MKWTTKALIQRILSKTWAGEKFYYLGQRYIGGFRHFTIDSKVQQGLSMLECLSELGEDIGERCTVEIGTGWTPIVPLLFWLNGQKECHTYDILRLITSSLVIESAKQFGVLSNYEKITQGNSGSKKRLEERIQLLCELVSIGASGSEIMRSCSIHYHAPVDAASTDLPDGSIDLVYSNTVLEHIPQHNIHCLFRECYRILRPGGYMLHLIDLSDHFAHSDPLISTINFLQVSEQSFSKYNSRFIFQNRLRPHMWRQIFSDHSFELIYWRTVVDEKALRQLPFLQLDNAFANLSANEICTSSIHVVAKRL